MTLRWNFLSAFFASGLFLSGVLARAETITTFTLTHGTDTISFSIVDSTPVKTEPYTFPTPGVQYTYAVPLTINGTVFPSDYPINAREVIGPNDYLHMGSDFFVQYDSLVNGQFKYTYFGEDEGQPYYTVVNGVPVFTPQTVTFGKGYSYDGANHSSSGDVLVIAQSVAGASPVPEPGTLGLLGTGLAGLVGVARRRVRSL